MRIHPPISFLYKWSGSLNGFSLCILVRCMSAFCCFLNATVARLYRIVVESLFPEILSYEISCIKINLYISTVGVDALSS
jgi:hypothetical protein